MPYWARIATEFRSLPELASERCVGAETVVYVTALRIPIEVSHVHVPATRTSESRLFSQKTHPMLFPTNVHKCLATCRDRQESCPNEHPGFFADTHAARSRGNAATTCR